MSAVSLQKDALHVYVGLAVMLATALVLRKPLSSPLPWLVAAAAAMAGETWDLWDDHAAGRAFALGASLHDLVNTLFWPTVLLILARWRRLRLR